jgi:hypothetical protein
MNPPDFTDSNQLIMAPGAETQFNPMYQLQSNQFPGEQSVAFQNIRSSNGQLPTDPSLSSLYL